MLDITKKNPQMLSDVGYEFEFILPELDIKEVYFTVIGEHSKAVKDYGRKVFNEIQSKNVQSNKFDLDDMEARAVAGACIRVIAWRGIQDNGKDLECNEENKKRVISMFGSLLIDRIMEESNNLGNFGKKLRGGQ